MATVMSMSMMLLGVARYRAITQPPVCDPSSRFHLSQDLLVISRVKDPGRQEKAVCDVLLASIFSKHTQRLSSQQCSHIHTRHGHSPYSGWYSKSTFCTCLMGPGTRVQWSGITPGAPVKTRACRCGCRACMSVCLAVETLIHTDSSTVGITST